MKKKIVVAVVVVVVVSVLCIFFVLHTHQTWDGGLDFQISPLSRATPQYFKVVYEQSFVLSLQMLCFFPVSGKIFKACSVQLTLAAIRNTAKKKYFLFIIHSILPIMKSASSVQQTNSTLYHSASITC